MQRSFEVILSLGSWLYLAGLLGLSGGFVLGVVGAAFSALDGDWLQAVVALVFAPPCAALSMVFYGLVGYPIYRKLSSGTSLSRTLRGEVILMDAPVA